MSRASVRAVVALWLAWMLPLQAPAAADTVRLKGGKTVDGTIVREDASVVVMVVSGVPQFFARVDVEAISRSGARFVTPTAVHEAAAVTPAEPIELNVRLIGRIRTRLTTFHWALQSYRNALRSTAAGRTRQASAEVHLAAEGLLPLHGGRFDPFSALADVLILLGLCAPTLWLALLLVKEGRSFTRIAELLVVGYGLAMLGMTGTRLADLLWVGLLGIPATFGAMGLLLAWMFNIEPRRAALALTLAIGLTLGTEYLLVRAHLI